MYNILVRDTTEDNLRVQVEWVRWFLDKHGFPSSKLRTPGDSNNDFKSYLGYLWNSASDMFKARQHLIPPVDVQTTLDLAGVSRSIMQLYDPLGMRLVHLPDKYRTLGDKLFEKNKALVQRYARIFEAKRKAVKKRLTENLKHQKESNLEPGS